MAILLWNLLPFFTLKNSPNCLLVWIHFIIQLNVASSYWKFGRIYLIGNLAQQKPAAGEMNLSNCFVVLWFTKCSSEPVKLFPSKIGVRGKSNLTLCLFSHGAAKTPQILLLFENIICGGTGGLHVFSLKLLIMLFNVTCRELAHQMGWGSSFSICCVCWGLGSPLLLWGITAQAAGTAATPHGWAGNSSAFTCCCLHRHHHKHEASPPRKRLCPGSLPCSFLSVMRKLQGVRGDRVDRFGKGSALPCEPLWQAESSLPRVSLGSGITSVQESLLLYYR